MSLNSLERKRKQEIGVKTKLYYNIDSKIPKPGYVYINYEIYPEYVVQGGMLFVTREKQKPLDSFSSHAVLQLS